MSKWSKFNKSIYSTHLFTALITLFTLILSFLFIWTHDDYWTVGTYNFERAWEYSFNYGNGRYLGNFFVNLIMCRPLLDDIIRMALLVIIVVCSAILADSYRKRSLLISFSLYLGVGKGLFGNVYVWGHGFYNFAPPVAIVLLSLCLLKKFYSKNTVSTLRTVLLCAVLFTFGVAQQLFSENSTTIILLISLITLVSVIIRKKTISPAITYFISSSLGAGIMFLLPKIMKIAYKMDYYRKVSGINEQVSLFIENAQISINALSTMCAISLFLSLSVGILMIKNKNQLKKGYFVCSLIVLCTQSLSSLLRFFFNLSREGKDLISIIAAYIFIIYLRVIVHLILKLTAKDKRCYYIGLLSLSMASVLQLLVVKPIGSRCFFITYALLALVTLSVFFEAIKTLSNKTKKVILSVVLVIGISFYIVVFAVYSKVCYINNIRLDYADEQYAAGKTEIEIINVPHERWLHYPNESYAYSYRYDLDDSGNIAYNITFTYIDYDEYLAKNSKTK